MERDQAEQLLAIMERSAEALRQAASYIKAIADAVAEDQRVKNAVIQSGAPDRALIEQVVREMSDELLDLAQLKFGLD